MPTPVRAGVQHGTPDNRLLGEQRTRKRTICRRCSTVMVSASPPIFSATRCTDSWPRPPRITVKPARAQIAFFNFISLRRRDHHRDLGGSHQTATAISGILHASPHRQAHAVASAQHKTRASTCGAWMWCLGFDWWPPSPLSPLSPLLACTARSKSIAEFPPSTSGLSTRLTLQCCARRQMEGRGRILRPMVRFGRGEI